MSQALAWAPLIPALPLAGAFVNGVFGKRLPRAAVSAVACGVLAAAAALTAWLFWDLPHDGRPQVVTLFPWIHAGSLRLDIAFQVDPLALTLMAVITGVGFLIHVYSTGYMHDDPGYARYFAYLNLFVFAMLVLVMASSLPLLFLGWEGVGLCSYLLIGFWYQDPLKASAGRKAFLVNRIGDVGFMLGVLWIFHTAGVLDYVSLEDTLARSPEAIPSGAITAIALLLFVGACGKSAQIPLYVWLPDAMAGPTPVSALIHAATMVTAGVYLVARLHFLYVLTPVAMAVVASVGAATALFAGTIGLAQNDIKKVLAYSTVSQLGYMFLGVGVGAFFAGIFHLVTHAFFKALLFLGSGSVIHALGGEQDLRRMGGLRRHIPWTWWTFLVGTIAIAGIPFFAGFYSKEEILLGALAQRDPALSWLPPVLGAVGLVAAGITAFYMARLLYLTFLGESRMSAETEHHVHESPASMVVPLVVLAVLSAAGGKLLVGPLHHFLEPVFALEGSGSGTGAAHGGAGAPHAAPSTAHGAAEGTHAARSAKPGDAGAPRRASAVDEARLHAIEPMVLAFSLFFALGGSGLGLWIYGRGRGWLDRVEVPLAPVRRALENKYWVDEAYDLVLVRPFWAVSRFLASVVDALGIDGFVNGLGRAMLGAGRVVVRWTTGNTQVYAVSIFLGMLGLLGLVAFG